MTTKSLSTFIFCSSCGLPGQLIMKTDGKHKTFYYGILHFKDKKGRLKKRIGSRFHSRYAYYCYLGKIAVTIGYEIVYPQPSAFAIAQRLVHFL